MNARKWTYLVLLSVQAVLTALATTGSLPAHWAAGFGMAGLAVSTLLKEYNAPELPPKGPSVVE